MSGLKANLAQDVVAPGVATVTGSVVAGGPWMGPLLIGGAAAYTSLTAKRLISDLQAARPQEHNASAT